MRSAHILAIGTELTLGLTADTNSAWLARQLAVLGIRCTLHASVSDDLAPLTALLRRSLAEADVILCTGGLGPTDDDLTRQALADVLDVPLVEDAASLQHLEQFFAARRRTMPQRNRVQAMLPAGAAALHNSCGTAPGIHATVGRTHIFALPGVPVEMRTMWASGVVPALRQFAGESVLVWREIRTYGRPEAEVNDLLGDLMERGKNPEVGTSAAGGEITIRVNVEADSAAEASRLLDACEQQVRQRLGWAVYGVDHITLADAVGDLLKARSETMCVAESCTAGLLGKLLTDRAGSSAYFTGGVLAYSNVAKRDLLGVEAALLEQHGAVSAAVAQAMASGAQQRFHADHALSVTGVAGPGGGTAVKPVGLVYIGLATRRAVRSKEFRFGPDQPREIIRERAARSALQMLRLQLMDVNAA